MQTPLPAPARFAVLRASSPAPLLPAQPPTSHAPDARQCTGHGCDAMVSWLTHPQGPPSALQWLVILWTMAFAYTVLGMMAIGSQVGATIPLPTRPDPLNVAALRGGAAGAPLCQVQSAMVPGTEERHDAMTPGYGHAHPRGEPA